MAVISLRQFERSLPMLWTLNCPGEKVWRARSLTDLEPVFAVR